MATTTTMGGVPQNMNEFSELLASMLTVMFASLEEKWTFALILCPEGEPYYGNGGVVTNNHDHDVVAATLRAAAKSLTEVNPS